MKRFLLFISIALFSSGLFGQTTLNKGDIAIISISTGDEEFAFVTLVDIDAGTEIYFTDEEADGDFTILTNEGHILYTAPSNISAGTVIDNNTNSANFTNAAGSFALGNSGDGIIAYQGTSAGNVTTFLHFVGEDAGDLGSLPANTLSSNEYVLLGNDDGNYDGITSGSAADLFSAINTLGNWLTSGSASINPPAFFTISSGTNPEPDNHPTNFLAATGSPSTSVIDLIWDDATGTDLPDGYLILANTNGTFTDPVDGTDPAEDTDLSDGSASIEVAQGVQSASFTGLSASTQYFFKIFPYANTGSNIDFKTDGTPQTANATTDAACGITALGSETISCTSNTSGSNNDFVTINIPYTGVDANAVVTIMVDGSGETNNGNNPASFTNGTLSFDAYEGAAWSVTITGGTCNLSTSGTVNSNECDLLPTAFINEFHYNDAGADANEFVEIALISTFAGSLSDFQVTLYNGNGGASYDSRTLNNLTVGNTTDGFTFYTWNPTSIQNGNPDGIALSYQGILIEFISYGGTFAATNGDANGQTSIDVGVSENDSTADTESIQRTGNCNGDACPVGLSWTGPSTATAGAKNTSQNLPIELTYFQAQKIKQQVLLSWETAIEINNDYMAIERSKDGRTFQEMGKIQGAGTTNTPQRYTYLDENPFTGTNYYRLRQVDFDGRATYHEVVAVNMASANQIRILPNPVNDFTTLQLTEVLETEGQVLIYDMMGKVAFETRLAAGQSNVEIDLSFLANGSYIIRLELTDSVVTERFVKQ